MSEKKKMVPQLRFPGFSGEWEERKLSNRVENIGTGKSVFEIQEKSADAPFPILGSTNVIGYDSDYDHEGDFVLTARVGANAGSLYHHSGKVKITDNTVFIQGKNLTFVYCLLKWFDLKRLSFGTGQPLIKTSELKDLILSFPNSEEQAEIGAFFKLLDNLITLHQRKLSHLQTRKKGLLQKMFPKDGELFPELRFPGFTDAWKMRKLSEVAEQTFGGGTPKTTVDEYWNGEISWIQSSDLTDGKVYGVVPNKTITKAGLNNSATKLVPANSIAIITRVGVGKLAFMPYLYATSQDFLSLSSLKIDPWFCVYSCYKKLQSELHVVQGTSIKGITKDELLAKNISVPANEEQQKIGAFFKQLDDSIALHQRKLDHLQNRKKALLQQMFV